MSSDTLRAVCRFIAEQRLLDSGDKVLVALSGGADSVALLHMLISLKEEFSISVAATHLNHGIRGDEADRDETFAIELCERWGVPLYHEKADVLSIAAQIGESAELCGRNIRYDFFDRVARDFGCTKLATAHHRDDNAETVLWNLTRGAGIEGLCGIPVKRDRIIRPLLCVSRAEIEGYCAEKGLEYVTDSTNLSDDYTRNKLRHQVLPVLRELNPGVVENIANTTSILKNAEDYLNKISLEELKKAETPYGYSGEKLLSLEPIVLQYAVKNVMENADAPVDFRHIVLIIEAMRSRGAVDLGQGCMASCAQGILRIIKKAAAADDLCMPLSEYIKTYGIRVTVQGGRVVRTDPPLEENSEKIHNLLLNHGIPYDIISCDTLIRRRRAGDTFTDKRRGVTKTLKKLMNELKIPRELRDTVPVVAKGSAVLWMQGVGTAAQAKADLTRDGEYIIIGG